MPLLEQLRAVQRLMPEGAHCSTCHCSSAAAAALPSLQPSPSSPDAHSSTGPRRTEKKRRAGENVLKFIPAGVFIQRRGRSKTQAPSQTRMREAATAPISHRAAPPSTRLHMPPRRMTGRAAWAGNKSFRSRPDSKSFCHLLPTPVPQADILTMI